jgi:hypothetical protein
MKAVREPKTDPDWDMIGIRSTDFRPHFDGDLVNVWSCIHPAKTRLETEGLLAVCIREMAAWILAHRAEFGRSDRFQLILAWPTTVRQTGRQIIKTGGDYEVLARIADGTEPVVPYQRWDWKVFDEPENP